MQNHKNSGVTVLEEQVERHGRHEPAATELQAERRPANGGSAASEPGVTPPAPGTAAAGWLQRRPPIERSLISSKPFDAPNAVLQICCCPTCGTCTALAGAATGLSAQLVFSGPQAGRLCLT